MIDELKTSDTPVRENRCVSHYETQKNFYIKQILARQVDILRKPYVSSHVVRRACY